jgi:hypothetical protein
MIPYLGFKLSPIFGIIYPVFLSCLREKVTEGLPEEQGVKF